MSAALTIAVIGEFQAGKSTLVNALLGRDEAEMGRGLSTTHENRTYALSPFVSLVDTPGFNADGQDDGTAKAAIDTADVLVYVHESNALGKSCVLEEVRAQGKPIVFLLNCCDLGKWSPSAVQNAKIVASIEAKLETSGLLPFVVPVAGKIVFPLNVLWARYGLGMEVDSNSEETLLERAGRCLRLPVASTTSCNLRAKLLDESGFFPVREFLMNLPLELLKHVVSNPKREIDRIVDRFAECLKKRWVAA